MIKMNWALNALGGNRMPKYDTRVLIWQTIPGEAVMDCSPFCKFIDPFLWLELARTFGNYTLPVFFSRYCKSDTDRGFRDWWIASLQKGPNSTDSERGIRQIIEGFRPMKDS